MNTAQLLDDLSSRGVALRAGRSQLFLKPKSALTDDLLEEVKRHKGELLTLLSSEQQRCARCLAQEAQGVKVLVCSCGYVAELEMPRPSAEDLKHTPAYVREQVQTLHQPYLGMWRYWVELYTSEGWSREHAERGAFRRVLLWKGYREVSPSG